MLLNFLALAFITLGWWGLVVSSGQNLIRMTIASEISLLGSTILLLVSGCYIGAFVLLGLAAADAAVILSLAVGYFRLYSTVEFDSIAYLNG